MEATSKNSIRLEILVPVPDNCIETLKEMCRLMLRIQLRHNAKKPIPKEYQEQFEKLKKRFLPKLRLPLRWQLDNFSLDSEAFLDEEEHAKLRAEVEGL